MENPQRIKSVVLGAACTLFSAYATAETIQTLGAGSAVTAADRVATFDSLTSSNVVHLDTYSEAGLSVTTSGNSWAEDFASSATFDPFHGANGTDRAFYAIAWGNEDWVTIQTTDSRKILAVEFMYGNGWTTGDIYGQYPWGNHDAIVEWQTWNGDALVSSGTIGATPILEMGTILGFHDPAGFDRLLARCTISASGNPNLQTLALDNLNVQLVPEPTTFMLLGGGLLGVIRLRTRARSLVHASN